MKIEIRNLEDGVHSFDFEADVDSLDLSSHQAFTHPVSLSCIVDKEPDNIIVTSRVATRVDLHCDGCLKDFEFRLNDEFRMLYTTDKLLADSDEDEMIEFISDSTNEIDLTNGVRDTLLLALPMKVSCSKDCKGLCPQCGADLNVSDCNCETSFVDSRWDALKKLVD